MGNGFARFSSKRDISLLLLGIDNAGKTTVLQNLAGEETDDDERPTVGFSSRQFKKGRYNVLLMDVGGGVNIRGIWPDYFAETHAIIYVIDASDASRIEESKVELQKVLTDERMACKPLLILCNKADENDCMGVVDVMQKLDLKNLLSQSHSVSNGSTQPKTRLWLCSALKSKTGNRSDKRLKRSMQWLLQSITDHWAILSPRVEAQNGVVLRQRERAKQERIERRRRVMEEEERLEQEALNVNADPNIQHPPSGTPIHSVSEGSQVNVNSEPVSKQNNVMSVVAEIEKGNTSPKPQGLILSPNPNPDLDNTNPKPQGLIPSPNPDLDKVRSNPGITLLEPSNDSNLKSFSTNTLPALPPVSLPNDLAINKPTTMSTEGNQAAGSPLGLRKAVLPPIPLTSPTEMKQEGENTGMLSDSNRGSLSPLAIATTGRDSSKGNSPSTLTDDSKPLVLPVKTSPTFYSSLPSITSDAPQISDGTNMGTSLSPLPASSKGATPLASSSITSLPVSDGNRDHPSASNRDHPSASDPNEIKVKKPSKLAMMLQRKNRTHPINDGSEQTAVAPTTTNSSTHKTAWEGERGVASVPSEVLRLVSINSEHTDSKGHSNMDSSVANTNGPPLISSNHPVEKPFLLPQDITAVK